MGDDNKKIIVDESFWFTATTLGINGFLVNSSNFHLSSIGLLLIGLVNVFSIYLLVHRSASYHNKLKGIGTNTVSDKFKKETLPNLWISIKHVPMIFAEFSGSLFYILLIVVSFLGVCSQQLQGSCCCCN